MLTLEGCRARQARFCATLAAQGIDAAVISDRRDIYYFSGALLPAIFPAILFLQANGTSWLASHDTEAPAAVTERLAYEYQMMATLNPDPLHQLNQVIARRVQGLSGVRRLGWQGEVLPHLLAGSLQAGLRPDAWSEIDELLAAQQLIKDADEVASLRRVARTSLAAYDAAQQVIAPGVIELEVLAAGRRAAMLDAGEPMEHGGDYQCGTLGGAARNRPIQKGELYIIDAQGTFQGYNADLCRTFVVGGAPTDLQQSVYDHLAAILRDVPTLVKPGGRGTDLFREIDRRIRQHPHLTGTGLIHHAGHGVGVRPHEAPDLNRDREGMLAVGQVFSVEPGAYSAELNGGIRLENTFHMTEHGLENLSEYPLNLIPQK